MLNQHQQAIKLVLTRFKSHAKATLLIALVIGVTMSLPGLFYLAADHISQLTNSMQEDNEVTVFLKLSANDDQVKSVNRVLKDHPQIKSFKFIAKEIAWETMQDKLKSTETLGKTSIIDNPLPHAFYVKGHTNNPTSLEALKNDLSQIPSVDHVLFNNEWSKRIASFLAITKKIIFFISALLGIGLLVIIGNTIRMQIVSQREEIEVSNLIGATHSFIRLPFLYAGTSYGFLGGLFAIAIIALSMGQFNQYITELANFYPETSNLGNISIGMAVLLLAVGSVLGWLGAYFVVNHTLKTIVSQQNKR